MRRLIIIISLCLVSFQIKAQRLTLSLTDGWLMPSDKQWSYISEPTFGLDVAMHWRLAEAQSAERPFSLGVRANYAYIPHGIAGMRICASGFVESPLYIEKSNELSFLCGAGLGFYTRPYELTKDESNEFIGSYTNCLIEVGATFTHQFASLDALKAAVKLVHNSNGYLLKPNQGLNYWQAEIGYMLPPKRITQFDADIRDYSHNSRGGYWFSYAPGLVGVRGNLPRHLLYYAHTAQLGYDYQFNLRRNVGGSVDLMYNYNNDTLAVLHGRPKPFPIYIGIAAGMEHFWGQLSVRTHVGAYLLRSEEVLSPFYERVGVFYHFGDSARWHVGVAVKAHYFHVDYIEWHLGFRL